MYTMSSLTPARVRGGQMRKELSGGPCLRLASVAQWRSATPGTLGSRPHFPTASVHLPQGRARGGRFWSTKGAAGPSGPQALRLPHQSCTVTHSGGRHFSCGGGVGAHSEALKAFSIGTQLAQGTHQAHTHAHTHTRASARTNQGTQALEKATQFSSLRQPSLPSWTALCTRRAHLAGTLRTLPSRSPRTCPPA
jgi:hypothetical protein